jgi:hypothetical protein
MLKRHNGDDARLSAIETGVYAPGESAQSLPAAGS